jgi:hypothetical protein
VTSFYDAWQKPASRSIPTSESRPEAAERRQFTRTQAEKFIQAALDTLASAPVGTINEQLNNAACTISHFIPTFCDRDQAERMLLDALTRTAYDGRTWKAGPTIASGLNQTTDTWVAEFVLDVPDVTVLPDQPDEIADWLRENLPHLDWHALWAAEDDDEWVIEPILPARRLVAMYSPPKVGKSLLALEMAAAVAAGRQVLGITPDRPRKVLYVDLENDPRGDVRERLQAMQYKPEDLDSLIYLSFPRLSMLDSEQGSRELLAAVDYHGCEVVIIDTISRVVAGEENNNDTWLAFYRHTGKKLKAAGIACLRLDHSGKDETKGQRGGSAKSGDVDLVWRLSTVSPDQTYRLDCEAHRMPVAEKTLVLHRETGPLRHRVDAEGRRAVWASKVEAVIKVLDEAGAPRDVSERRARELVKPTAVKASNEVLREALKVRRMTLGAPSGAGAPEDSRRTSGAVVPIDRNRRSDP